MSYRLSATGYELFQEDAHSTSPQRFGSWDPAEKSSKAFRSFTNIVELP
jgi:hypothetical protein